MSIIGASGAIKCVIDCCRPFTTSNEKLSRSLLQLLANLSFNCDENKREILQCDGVTDVLKIVDHYNNDSAIVGYALSALRNICTYNVVRDGAIEDEIITDIIEIIFHHKSSETIVEMGLWSLINLLLHNVDNKKNLVEEKGLDLIHEAMINYDNKKIIQAACILIHQLAKIASNRAAIANKMIALDLIQIILAHTNDENNELLISAANAVYRLSYHDKIRAQLIEGNVIGPYIKLLSSQHDHKLLTIILKTLYNVCKDENGRKNVIDKGIMTALIILKRSKSSTLKKTIP